jgi:hypothetical protein
MRLTVERTQASGRVMARWFIPDSRIRLAIRDLVLRMAGSPTVAPLLRNAFAVGRSGPVPPLWTEAAGPCGPQALPL